MFCVYSSLRNVAIFMVVTFGIILVIPPLHEWYLGWMSHILEDQPRMKSRYPSPNHEWKVDTRAVGKGIYFSWVVGARVSTFHEWLVRKYMAHPTKIPRVGGGIIDLHHEPTLDTPNSILNLYFIVHLKDWLNLTHCSWELYEKCKHLFLYSKQK